MTLTDINKIYKAQLTDSDFKKLSEFIFSQYGIKMPEVKRTMLQGRLQKRLKVLEMENFSDYVDYVFSKEGLENEVIHMIDLVSTNKTDFFREPVHFEFLHNHVLPEFLSTNERNRIFKFWSAGCSSGEEPYTIAMSMSDFSKLHKPIEYQILATDISFRMLQSGVDAIYKEEKVTGLPLDIKKQYLLKSKDRLNPTVRIIPELRKKVTFRRLNFMDNYYSVQETYDVVFCRNVLIYFDRATQENVITKLCTHLRPGGYFFLGHSESITNLKVPLKQIKPTIFKRI